MLRMRFRFWILGLLGLAAVCQAQTFEQQENVLREALLKKTFCLRNFSAEGEVDYAWNGSSLESVAPAVRTLGALKVTNVKVTRDQVEIDGVRRTLLKKKEQSLVWEGMESPAKIIVTLKGAEPTTLTRLPDLLFFPSEEMALAAIPQNFRAKIPAPNDIVDITRHRNTASTQPLCDCATDDAASCGHQLKPLGWIPPEPQERFLVPPVPQQALNSRKSSLTGAYAYWVDENGQSTDFWIALPAGFGIDEMVLKMLAKMTYKAATCHNKPEADVMTYEFNLHLNNPSQH